MEGRGKWVMGKKTGYNHPPEWDDTVSDLSSMRLSKQEQAKMMSARQSQNLAIARAELMERSRQKGKGSPFLFSPALSAKLRASGFKTVEEVLADGSAALSLAQTVKKEELSQSFNKVENYFRNQIQASESSKQYLDEDSDEGILAETGSIQEHHLQQQQQQQQQSHIPEDEESKRGEMSVVQRNNFLSSEATEANPYPLSPQGWQNLNNTIQLVVKTCEALWQQLEEERLTRQRLHFQLQEQRSVITTLTAELLQIQEHQEMILKELASARSSSLPFSRPTREDLMSQQQPQQHFQSPFKQAPDSSLKGGRIPPRSYAFSDGSLEARPGRIKTGEKDRAFNKSHSPLPNDQFFRLGLQGKSKSASQLDRTQELANTMDQRRLNPVVNPTGLDFLQEASVLDMLRNYHISDG